MTFIDWFAGIGGFRKGMELAGHECVGFCEYDKFASASYRSMHTITNKQREYLKSLDLRNRQKEILKGEYLNGEWFAEDIRTVKPEEIPGADCWCFGFPCQDISVAGKAAGIDGKRSSLFFGVTELIRGLPEEKRPTYLLIENVKNLLSVNRGWDFTRVLIELDEVGYDVEWRILNTKDFGIPQNRERCFIIGYFRGRCRSSFLLNKRTGGENSKKLVNMGNTNPSGRGINGNCYLASGLAPTLTTNKGEGNKIVIPVLTPDRVVKRQNGRRFKDPGEESFTLTTQDRHGVAVSGYKINSSIWCKNLQCYVYIRKLTPKECFRLQGWTDGYFEKAKFVNSDSRLYKQAGNGVTVNVVYEIGKRMVSMRGESDE